MSHGHMHATWFVFNLEGHLFEACGSNGRLKPNSMFVYHQSCAEGILSVKA